MEKEIQVTHILPAEAAAVIAAAGLKDPARGDTPESIARGADCYRVRDGQSEGVLVLRKRGDQMWVGAAAAVQSRGLFALGSPLVDAIARQSDCRRIGFQTGRPGLVKLARTKGYRVVGFIMEKEIS